MITKKQKERMLDYLVYALEGSNEKIVPMKKNLVGDIISKYILIGDNGVLLLIDSIYPNDSLNRFYGILESTFGNIGTILYKDGETFFRSAAKDKYYKKEKGLSLKNYSDDDIRRMIMFRPEERFLHDKQKKIQYYQPESNRLREGIETFQFHPAELNYNHIPPHRFRPEDTYSKKLFIWDKNKRFHTEGPVKLVDNLLIPIKISKIVTPEPIFKEIERQDLVEYLRQEDEDLMNPDK